MNNGFPHILIINKWIEPASFGSERVYYTTIVFEKNASTITVFQTTLSFTFNDKIFELVSLPGDSLYINTCERHTGLYTTFNTVVDLAWNATAQEMFLGIIHFFWNLIPCIPRLRLLKCLYICSLIGHLGFLVHVGDEASLTHYHLFINERIFSRAFSIFKRAIICTLYMCSLSYQCLWLNM